jgi:hypothetical protein
MRYTNSMMRKSKKEQLTDNLPDTDGKKAGAALAAVLGLVGFLLNRKRRASAAAKKAAQLANAKRRRKAKPAAKKPAAKKAAAKRAKK